MIPTSYYILLGSGLFTIGVIGVLTRRNVLVILMSIELILNAVNINLVALSQYFHSVDGHFRNYGCGRGGSGRTRPHHRAFPEQGNSQRG
jgi:multisubunit Na+/H+ antiporter MnhC subunit